MPTLVLSPRQTPDSQKLWRSAVSRGWDVDRMSTFRIPEGYDPPEPVLYGEPFFNTSVCEALIRIGIAYTGRCVQILTVAEAQKIDHHTFFKPPDDKFFPAGIYENGLALPDYLEPYEFILCQDVLNWHDEFRFFILDGQIWTYSCYIHDTHFVGDSTGFMNPEHFKIVRKFLKRFLTEYLGRLPRTIVIDAGMYWEESVGLQPAIIEANQVSSSGLYQCNPEAVLDVLQASVRKAI